MVGVAFEQPQLSRYYVQFADGRPAVMDVAPIGSQGAAALDHFARTLPPGYILDHGIDLVGRLFVIAIPQAFGPPAPPPPPPAAPMTKATRNVLIGVGVLAAAGLGVVIYLGTRTPPKPPMEISAHGMWEPGCEPQFKVTVSARSDSKVKVLDRTQTIDYMGEVTFTFTAAELGDKAELVVEADHRRGHGKETIAIDPPPRDFPPVSGAHFVGEAYGSPVGTVSVAGAPPVELTTSYGGDDAVSALGPTPAGQTRVEMTACHVAPQTTDAGPIDVVVTADTVSITVDVGEQLLRVAGEPPAQVDVAARLTTDDGRPIELHLQLDAPSADNPAYRRLAAVATTPITDAPAVADVAPPRPLLMMWNGQPDRDLLGGAAPLAAPYIAIVTTVEKSSGSCGPYSLYAYSYSGEYASRYRYDVAATVYEARTGAVVARKSFKGKKPGCPSYVTSYGGSISPIYGDPPTKAVTKWLDGQRR